MCYKIHLLLLTFLVLFLSFLLLLKLLFPFAFLLHDLSPVDHATTSQLRCIIDHPSPSLPLLIFQELLIILSLPLPLKQYAQLIDAFLDFITFTILIIVIISDTIT